jgi:hypothetical protein
MRETICSDYACERPEAFHATESTAKTRLDEIRMVM